eukprot:GHVT01002386.1.p1 GENE.GHVT01002386.1~~GHVT01002386.1.p1  ORF type:complete len:383 (+),score=65.54 GHVT01002386.1:743-1891(+)
MMIQRTESDVVFQYFIPKTANTAKASKQFNWAQQDKIFREKEQSMPGNAQIFVDLERHLETYDDLFTKSFTPNDVQKTSGSNSFTNPPQKQEPPEAELENCPPLLHDVGCTLHDQGLEQVWLLQKSKHLLQIHTKSLKYEFDELLVSDFLAELRKPGQSNCDVNQKTEIHKFKNTLKLGVSTLPNSLDTHAAIKTAASSPKPLAASPRVEKVKKSFEKNKQSKYLAALILGPVFTAAVATLLFEGVVYSRLRRQRTKKRAVSQHPQEENSESITFPSFSRAYPAASEKVTLSPQKEAEANALKNPSSSEKLGELHQTTDDGKCSQEATEHDGRHTPKEQVDEPQNEQVKDQVAEDEEAEKEVTSLRKEPVHEEPEKDKGEEK